MSDDAIKSFKYIFEIASGETVEQEIVVEKEIIESQVNNSKEFSQWTNLTYHQCDNCKLKSEKHCPVAIRLAEPIEKFHKYKSHQEAKVTVITDERTYSKETNVQDGLRSMFGLIMATSGCPSMKALRPMALYHLPFSSLDETIYRVVSMYLLECFLHDKKQDFVPIAMQELQEMYDAISTINLAMTKRLSSFVENDSTLNAVVGLDALRYMVPLKMERSLEALEKVFVRS